MNKFLNKFIPVIPLFFLFQSGYAQFEFSGYLNNMQNVMFEDINVCDPVHPDTIPPGSAWQHFLDSLVAHGVSLHYISEEGWDALDSMDALYLFQLWSPYPESIELRIIDFARNGGKIVIWNAA